MKIVRRSRGGAEIPTASMSDIAFLLLLFFMVTTVFVSARGLKDVIVPKAEATERIRLRRNVASVWVNKDGLISIDDKLIPGPDAFAMKIIEKMDANRQRGAELVVLLRVDKNARYGLVDALIEKMRDVKALKLTFATQEEST